MRRCPFQLHITADFIFGQTRASWGRRDEFRYLTKGHILSPPGVLSKRFPIKIDEASTCCLDIKDTYSVLRAPKYRTRHPILA